MTMLTIGAFAKASRLSPKALRLYDELELLRPARVDPDTGYRYYAPEQLERARLVAWLRRLGMPLARIRQVCALEPGAAAREIHAYWARVETETATRRDLAAFLVDHLTHIPTAAASAAHAPRKDTTTMLELRYSALSDTGLVRTANQDTAHAGARVLAVADGFGAGGAPASTAAVEALKHLDEGPLPAGGVLNLLEDAVQSAARAVQEAAASTTRAGSGAEAVETGTTLTAMLWTGSQLALVHIGDTRAYVLRDGALFRITHDHTLVQSLIDEGRLTPEEATAHPQRTLLLKALTTADPDLRLHDAQPGDRYLLCSDGLPLVVPDGEIRRLLSSAPTPDEAARALVDAVHAAGAPDNVSCVVADVVETDPRTDPS
ncbi:MerR family transcriptional regulator [Streptomyces sp. NPDC008313]|uniref:MerR family transcriptional regulator n=1 Tax=Streptomyces sp. NPDC008313 TaxID=3364826 RepID=UPI0036EC7582